ncbi:MAG TPA: hypothetical protein VF421_19565 [Niabella sp.]
MADSLSASEYQIPLQQTNPVQPLISVSPAVLKDIKDKLATWYKMANWLQAILIILGALAIGCSLFITAFAGAGFLGTNNIAIRILAFITTLFLTLITSFNLSTKANNCRNAWRHLNKALYSYNSKRIDGDALIKAYEEGENLLGSVDFNFNANSKDSQ